MKNLFFLVRQEEMIAYTKVLVCIDYHYGRNFVSGMISIFCNLA